MPQDRTEAPDFQGQFFLNTHDQAGSRTRLAACKVNICRTGSASSVPVELTSSFEPAGPEFDSH
jgi:hypothetical protein